LDSSGESGVVLSFSILLFSEKKRDGGNTMDKDESRLFFMDDL